MPGNTTASPGLVRGDMKQSLPNVPAIQRRPSHSRRPNARRCNNGVTPTFFVNVWTRIRASFWFVPTLMILSAVALFVATFMIDQRLPDSWIDSLPYLYAGGPDGARALLSMMAGSMMTVTGVVFSVTIVAFSLASQQFSPRVLRNFMRDPGNQFVLGTFMATFVYCLLVLRVVRDTDGGQFVPNASVTCATLLAVMSIGVLVYFVHHAALAIQAPTIIGTVSSELNSAIRRLYPEHLGAEGRSQSDLTDEERKLVEKGQGDARSIPARRSGYLEAIDGETLMETASKTGLVIKLLRRPGDFVAEDEVLAEAWPAERCPDEVVEAAQKAMAFSSQRTEAQDIEFLIQQLVEIALRALSPSLNDPFTATACVDRLRDAYGRMVQQERPQPYRFDAGGNLRLITHPRTFRNVLESAFNPLRQSAQSSVPVTIRMLESLEYIGRLAIRKEDRAELLRQARMIERGSREAITEAEDRADIEQAFTRVCDALEGGNDLELRRKPGALPSS